MEGIRIILLYLCVALCTILFIPDCKPLDCFEWRRSAHGTPRRASTHHTYSQPIAYYSNSTACFQLAILLSGDVQLNPGPSSSSNHPVDGDYPNQLHVNFSSTANHAHMIYGASTLHHINDHGQRLLHQDVWSRISELGIGRRQRTHRGRRAPSYFPHQPTKTIRDIPVIIQPRQTKPVSGGNAHQNLRDIPRHDPSKPTNIKVGLWNAHSVRNKSFLLSDYICEQKLDIIFLTETWLHTDDPVVIKECTPPDYTFLSIPRHNSGHGGIGVVFKSHLNLTVKKIDSLVFNTFELAYVVNFTKAIKFLVVYRPPPSSVNRYRISEFLTEFEMLVNEIALLSGHVVLLGDFNMHVDSPAKTDVARFLSIIETGNLSQHVQGPTHVKGHTLDLVMTTNTLHPSHSLRESDDIDNSNSCQIRDLIIHQNLLSDHHCIQFGLTFPSLVPANKRAVHSVRKFRSMDQDGYSKELSNRLVNITDNGNVNDMLNAYNTTVTDCLDTYAPRRTFQQSTRLRRPWFNDDILSARRSRRKAERKWRKHPSDVNRTAFEAANKLVNDQIVLAKEAYLHEKLDDADSKTIFQTVNNLLNKDSRPLPAHDSPAILGTRFADFFATKILNIRNELASRIPPNTANESVNDNAEMTFSTFDVISEATLKAIMMKMSSTSCSLDPQPTWLVKNNLDCHVPALTKLVNTSLQSGEFPSAAHHAIITPILKKPSLNKDDISNYRPVSNIPFIAKVIEKAVASQFVAYLIDQNLYDPMQSAYRSCHSTETALLKLQNDTLSFFNERKAVLLVLLDLSAAFDTVDHNILLQRLKFHFSVTGSALEWFTSYLHGWTSRVSISGVLSDPQTLKFGVPQGSVLGPILFSIYITPISEIFRKYNLQYIIYADDIQIYAPFDPRSPEDFQKTLHSISECVIEIEKWMSLNFLKVNSSKTEFMLMHSVNCQVNDFLHTELNVSGHTIKLSSQVMNLGICLDSNFKLTSHVSNVIKTCNFHLRNLWRIRRFLNTVTCHHVVRALILSRIDYCNSLFTVLSSKDKKRIDSVVNRAARLIYAVGRGAHTSPLLRELHWLPFNQRILFKICLYIYKILHEISPSYLNNIITLYKPTRNLRSVTDTSKLVVPRSHFVFVDKRFAIAASVSWNALPQYIRQMPHVLTFKKHLKSFLFPDL